MTKRNTIIFSLACALFFGLFILFVRQLAGLCQSDGWCDLEGPLVSAFLTMLTAGIMTFPFSLVTYRMNDLVFIAWRNFALWWIPLMAVVSFLLVAAQKETSGLGIAGAYEQSFILLILASLYVIFVLVSTIIIFWKWYSLRKK